VYLLIGFNTTKGHYKYLGWVTTNIQVGLLCNCGSGFHSVTSAAGYECVRLSFRI